jgi:hypothetical protein
MNPIKKQEIFSRNYSSTENCFPKEVIQQNPALLKEILRPSDYRILDTLIGFEHKYQSVFPSQHLLAHMTGLKLSYVHKRIRFLSQEGFLSKIYRHRHTCVYILSPFFRLSSTVKALKEYIPNLKYFMALCITLLTAGKERTINFPYSFLRIKKTSSLLTSSLIQTHSPVLTSSLITSTAQAREDAEQGWMRGMREEGASGNALRPIREEVFCKQKGEGEEVGGEIYAKTTTVGNVNPTCTPKKEHPISSKTIIFEGNRLTVAGHTDLYHFEQEIIDYAVKTLHAQKCGSIKNPLAWIVSFCEKHHRIKNIPVNYSKLNQMRAAIGYTGLENKWEVATQEEIDACTPPIAIASKESKKKNNEPELVTQYISAADVEKNVKLLEKSPLFRDLAGKKAQALFSEESQKGETVIRTKEQLDRMARLQRKRIDEVTVRDSADPSQTDHPTDIIAEWVPQQRKYQQVEQQPAIVPVEGAILSSIVKPLPKDAPESNWLNKDVFTDSIHYRDIESSSGVKFDACLPDSIGSVDPPTLIYWGHGPNWLHGE